jgi:thiol-disulfide isomerase/thioredoxin
VRNGERFRIADLVADGRVVFLETMAIWCANCRRQQGDVVVALSQLDPARVTWIGVDVDSSESAEALAEYSRRLGFDWPFVVAGQDLARAFATEFGDQVLSPPSTPIVVVGIDGRVTLTEFGHKSIDRIVQLAHEHGA